MEDQSVSGEVWSKSVRDSLAAEGANIAPDCAVFDSLGDMLYSAGGEFFVAVAGNGPDDARTDPVKGVMVLHVHDILMMANKVVKVLVDEGKIDYLRSLGVTLPDMSEEDAATPEHPLH